VAALLFAALFVWLLRRAEPPPQDQVSPPPPPQPPKQPAAPPVHVPPVIAEPWRPPTPPPQPVRPPSRRSTSKSTREAEIGANSTLAFIDTETTGLSRDDRIVSLAIATMQAADLRKGKFKLKTVHLVFNPARPCHPRASAVHGWTDRTLARQPRFADHAAEIAECLARADVWLMHNVAYDRPLLTREFDAISRPILDRPTFCTQPIALARQAMLQWLRGDDRRSEH
jgi:DNA polymerase III epsilon subunit-like protein